VIAALSKYLPEAPGPDELSRPRQLLEMAMLYLLRRIGPGYYLQARWGRASVPFADKWNHVNRSEYLRIIHQLNPRDYQKVSQHKLVEKAVMQAQGLNTAKALGFVHATRGRRPNGALLRSPEDLSEALAQHDGRRVCFKHVEGYGGFGFASYVVEHRDGECWLRKQADGPAISMTQWWAEHRADSEGFLLEEHLTQHPALAALNASSVNTVRMWTVSTPQGWKTIGAYLRVGREGVQVDNNASGGIACPVDVVTGRVIEAFLPAVPRQSVPKHPDSGATLEGFQVPDWEAALHLAGEAIAAFPHMHIAGLDMAFTPDGPALIELNVCPDYIGCAWMGLPLRSRLAELAVARAVQMDEQEALADRLLSKKTPW
jgi:hypothetical protein